MTNNTKICVDNYLDIDGHSSENKVNWLLSDCLRLERTVCRSETSPDVDAGKTWIMVIIVLISISSSF